MNDRFHHFKVVSPDAHGRDTVIEMDGVPLKGVTNIQVDLSTLEANRITLTMIAGSLNAEVVGEDFVEAVVDDPPA